MPNDDLESIEKAAVRIALGAGKILLTHFTRPLDVEYKEDFQKSPVTDADHASDSYIKQQIVRLFPTHAILSEEDKVSDEKSAEYTWVIDPLDGTTNFMHGVPIFGICIAILRESRPVVAAIFVPSITQPQGVVLHARIGGGAKLGNVKVITVSDEVLTPKSRLISSMPSHFAHMFGYRLQTWMHLGDVRSLGSVAFEMALVAQGILDYVIFKGPYIWDVAAGVLLAKESGCAVLVYDSNSKKWTNFEKFQTSLNNEIVTSQQLRDWRGALLIGKHNITLSLAEGIKINNNRIVSWYKKIRRKWIRRNTSYQTPK